MVSAHARRGQIWLSVRHDDARGFADMPMIGRARLSRCEFPWTFRDAARAEGVLLSGASSTMVVLVGLDSRERTDRPWWISLLLESQQVARSGDLHGGALRMRCCPRYLLPSPTHSESRVEWSTHPETRASAILSVRY